MAEPAPTLPVGIERDLRARGFTGLMFFAEKRLIQNDLSLKHDRLQIEVVTNIPYLTPQEQATLDCGEGIQVTLMNSQVFDWNLTLRRNLRGGASSYVLTNNWYNVAMNQIAPGQTRLQVNQIVRLWSCRIPGDAVFYVFVEALIESRSRERGRRR
ncbi:hypothetical protein FH972_018819 [Carpinus fangiana]|uniref:TF-B3 domain-containing protein n=1 Tax=Carpinus fangiana TaxID=176857 RepID=A0A5N6RRJ7_9ROSI|nr:hypothetical protein FH972_018819 [Carpinus fangiana]